MPEMLPNEDRAGASAGSLTVAPVSAVVEGVACSVWMDECSDDGSGRVLSGPWDD